MTEAEVRAKIREILVDEFDVYRTTKLRWRRGQSWMGQAVLSQLFGHKPYIVGAYVLTCDWQEMGGLSVCCQRCGCDFTTEPEEHPTEAGECESDWSFWRRTELPTLTP